MREHTGNRFFAAFTDAGPRQVKNIAEPVHVFRSLGWRVRRPPAAQTPTVPPQITRCHCPDKPSVAVLPFTNMSADPEQEFFADGIAEDVITALSRYPLGFL